MRRAFLLLFVLVLATMSLASGQSRKVKPGDVVTVQCDEETTLNKQYTIDKSGFIVLPMVGAVQVAGLDESDASAKISDAMVSAKILPKASVNLKVDISTLPNPTMSAAGARPMLAVLPNPTINPMPILSPAASVAPTARFVTVMGRVGSPRYVPYVEGMTAADAISAAGGMLPHASPKVRIERKVDGKTVAVTE